jgi:hypothetical protein
MKIKQCFGGEYSLHLQVRKFNWLKQSVNRAVDTACLNLESCFDCEGFLLSQPLAALQYRIFYPVDKVLLLEAGPAMAI